jgi:SAM-dependent methyltransferase
VHEYIEKYRDGGLYDTIEYGSPYISKGVRFARYLLRGMSKGQKVLCIGCGNGWEVLEYLKAGMDAYGTETHDINVPVLNGRIVNALCPFLPFDNNAFDLVHCTEVLEHIPEDLTDEFLKECKRIGKKFFFSIASEKDSFDSHINLHNVQWWLDKFCNAGFTVENVQYKPKIELILGDMIYVMNYAEGFVFICKQ